MELSPEQASLALHQIAGAQRKVAVFAGYQRAAPHLWLWGLIWFLGYGITGLAPQHTGPTWLVLNLAGFATAAWLASRQSKGGPDDSLRGPWALPARHVLGVGLMFALFIAATCIVFEPTPTQVAAFPALLVGFAYATIGIWGGLRWLVAGIGLSLLTLAGYLLMPQHFMLWMAVCGGGTLVASGFWMKAR